MGHKTVSDDVLGKQFQLHSEILILCHWCAQIEILDVNGHKFCVWCGYDAVEE